MSYVLDLILTTGRNDESKGLKKFISKYDFKQVPLGTNGGNKHIQFDIYLCALNYTNE